MFDIDGKLQVHALALLVILILVETVMDEITI